MFNEEISSDTFTVKETDFTNVDRKQYEDKGSVKSVEKKYEIKNYYLEKMGFPVNNFFDGDHLITRSKK
ncbi:hypothetical protein NUSPORA_00341 [Nucleospora cyclopteri]